MQTRTCPREPVCCLRRDEVVAGVGVAGGNPAGAGGVGATPIPFSDAIAIVPIQVTMLASISAVWGLPTTTAYLGTLVSGAITGAGSPSRVSMRVRNTSWRAMIADSAVRRCDWSSGPRTWAASATL